MNYNLDFEKSAGIVLNLVTISLSLGRASEAKEAIRMALVEASKREGKNDKFINCRHSLQ